MEANQISCFTITQTMITFKWCFGWGPHRAHQHSRLVPRFSISAPTRCISFSNGLALQPHTINWILIANEMCIFFYMHHEKTDTKRLQRMKTTISYRFGYVFILCYILLAVFYVRVFVLTSTTWASISYRFNIAKFRALNKSLRKKRWQASIVAMRYRYLAPHRTQKWNKKREKQQQQQQQPKHHNKETNRAWPDPAMLNTVCVCVWVCFGRPCRLVIQFSRFYRSIQQSNRHVLMAVFI